MTFTSEIFFLFLGCVFAAYYAVSFSGAWQLFVLVAASGIFYAWDNPALLVLLIAVGVLAGAASFAIDRMTRESSRRLILTLGVVALLGVLGFFKYGDLFYRSLVGIGRNPQWEKFFVGIPLPIGISFYVFHAISLLVDVHRGQYRVAQKTHLATHLARTGLYISFFPQLIAGPITKARNFYPQITGKKLAAIDWPLVLHFLLLGYFFKMVVADNLAVQTTWMNHPYFETRSGIELVTLAIGYSCQIFADFFGYSLIAMGLALMFGYVLPQNFNRPYIAASFSEFWRRWHMSLSAWLRDYLYIPLGGSRKGELRTYVNLFVVMVLGGLWHGASWSFAIWGGLHGAALAAERPLLNTGFYRLEGPAMRAIRMLMVFGFVTIAWLFFKLDDYAQAFTYLATIFLHYRMHVQIHTLLNVWLYCIPIALYHAIPLMQPVFQKPAVRTFAYAAMLFLILTNSGVPGAFIYFRF